MNSQASGRAGGNQCDFRGRARSSGGKNEEQCRKWLKMCIGVARSAHFGQYCIIYYAHCLHGGLYHVEVKNCPDKGENWFRICQKEHITQLIGGSIIACSKLCSIAISVFICHIWCNCFGWNQGKNEVKMVGFVLIRIILNKGGYQSQTRLANSLGDRPGIDKPWCGRSLYSGRNSLTRACKPPTSCQDLLRSQFLKVRTNLSAIPFVSGQWR